MQTTSVFCAECLCGRHFESEQREYTCPNCKRTIFLAWGMDQVEEPESHPNMEREEEAA